MHRYLILLILCACGSAMAHEFTPTYPELKPSHVKDVLTARMYLLNMRDDVEYYRIDAYDHVWNPVGIAVPSGNPMQVKHLKKKTIDVYIREKDKERAYYICSTSKLQLRGGGKTAVESRICSRIK